MNLWSSMLRWQVWIIGRIPGRPDHSGTSPVFLPAILIFSYEKVYTLSEEVCPVPHTSLEPLSQSEIIVIGGSPNRPAESVVIDTVSIINDCTRFYSDFQITGEATKLEIADTSVSSASRM